MRLIVDSRATSVFGAILEQLQRLKKEALSESQTAYVMELVFEVEVDLLDFIPQIVSCWYRARVPCDVISVFFKHHCLMTNIDRWLTCNCA